jgi:hypothetical protein
MKIGDRVKLTGHLVNPGSEWMPVEKDMEPGLEGTIVNIYEHKLGFGQIKVNWDNGRGLGLFPTDPFIVLKPTDP